MTANVFDTVVIGGGGHARVLIDAIKAAHPHANLAVVDADASRAGSSLLGVPIVGNDDILAELVRNGTRQFVIGVAGVRDNGPRARLFERARELGLEPITVIHPGASVSQYATVGAGCQIFAGAIVNACATLGVNVVVNTGAIVEHDCIVDDHAHVATGARLAGAVHVEALAHIGAGSVVRQLLRVGRAAVVGAGAAVVKDVRPSAVVAGVPAKELTR